MFFGGYRFFGLEQVSAFFAIAIVLFKSLIGYWIIMWVKYTLMRIRIDHMLAFNWKFLTPVAFALLMVTAFVHALLTDTLGVDPASWAYVLSMFLSNVLVAWIALETARAYSRRERAKVEGRSRTVEASRS
jgi:NADH-quinone oxidoreductase subunit H